MKALFRTISPYAILLVLVLALFLRLGYNLHETFPAPDHDQKNYTTLVVQLLDHGFYGYLEEKPNTLVTPGFPIFLAIVFKLFGYSSIADAQQHVRIVQSFMSLLIVWFLYLTGKRLFNRAAGLLAALFAAVYGPFVISSSLILTEVLFLTLLTALLYWQVRIIQENRIRDHIFAGLLMGLAVLTRPNSIVLAATPYVYLWFRYRRPFIREIAIGAGAFLLAMLPWWIRNWLTFHELILISKGGAGNPFLFGTDPYNRGTIDPAKINWNDQLGEGLKRVKAGFKEDPWLWIRWYTTGKMKVMYLNTIYQWPYVAFLPRAYVNFLIFLHYFLVYAGMFFAAAASFWNRNVLFLAFNFALFLGIHLLFIPEPRYTIGTFPYLMLITAYVVTSLPRWILRARLQR